MPHFLRSQDTGRLFLLLDLDHVAIRIGNHQKERYSNNTLSIHELLLGSMMHARVLANTKCVVNRAREGVYGFSVAFQDLNTLTLQVVLCLDDIRNDKADVSESVCALCGCHEGVISHIELDEFEETGEVVLCEVQLSTCLVPRSISTALGMAQVSDAILCGELDVEQVAHAENIDVEVFHVGEVVGKETEMVDEVAQCFWRGWAIRANGENAIISTVVWLAGCSPLNGH